MNNIPFRNNNIFDTSHHENNNSNTNNAQSPPFGQSNMTFEDQIE